MNVLKDVAAVAAETVAVVAAEAADAVVADAMTVVETVVAVTVTVTVDLAVVMKNSINEAKPFLLGRLFSFSGNMKWGWRGKVKHFPCLARIK